MFFISVFDPLTIIAQIILLQSVFYVLMGIWLLVFNVLFHVPLHCAVLFSSKALSHGGWGGVLIYALTALLLPILFRHVVLRSKLCLDFTLTLFGFHLLFTFIYDNYSIPRSLFFWLVTIVCVLYTVVVSEYQCMQVEMQDIPVGFLNSGNEDIDRKKDDDNRPKRGGDSNINRPSGRIYQNNTSPTIRDDEDEFGENENEINPLIANVSDRHSNGLNEDNSRYNTGIQPTQTTNSNVGNLPIIKPNARVALKDRLTHQPLPILPILPTQSQPQTQTRGFSGINQSTISSLSNSISGVGVGVGTSRTGIGMNNINITAKPDFNLNRSAFNGGNINTNANNTNKNNLPLYNPANYRK